MLTVRSAAATAHDSNATARKSSRGMFGYNMASPWSNWCGPGWYQWSHGAHMILKIAQLMPTDGRHEKGNGAEWTRRMWCGLLVDDRWDRHSVTRMVQLVRSLSEVSISFCGRMRAPTAHRVRWHCTSRRYIAELIMCNTASTGKVPVLDRGMMGSRA
jgi:hypothetical protein